MKKIIITAVVIVVLAVGAAFLYRNHSQKNVQVATQQGSGADQGTRTDAAPGKIASALPSDLVVGASPAVSASYEIAYAQSTQGTAVYDTSDSMDSLFQEYSTYFQKNNYEILNQKKDSQASNLYAINTTANVNVLIVPSQTKGKNSVTISYLKK